jgi:uncharacterized protein DUF5335
MATRRIDKAEWRDFMDSLTHDLVGQQAEVEIAALGLGTRIAAEWLGLFGFNYDPRADVIEIALDGVDHMIHAPREVWVELGGASGLSALEIVAADDTRQIVRLREPLRLAAPAHARADAR